MNTKLLNIFIRLIALLVIVAILPSGVGFAISDSHPEVAVPFGEELNSGNVARIDSTTDFLVRSLTDANLFQTGADRLASLQNNDGGWDWPLDDGNPASVSPLNTLGPIGKGLAEAYLHTGDPDHQAALMDAGALLLTKTNNFSPSDGYLASTLDGIWGGTTYTTHVITYFYGPLAAGTYDRNGAGTLYDTAGYVNLIRTARASQGIANLAAWDIGMGLVGAASAGADTTAWIAGVKAEIDELNGAEYYDVIGLAGAVYGLAYVGEDFDPTAGQHAAATNLADLGAILVSYQISSGGFTWNSGSVSPGDESNQETSYAILALNELDRTTYLSDIMAAADYLESVQLPTGGWDSYPGEVNGENNELTAEALWGIHTAYPLMEVWVCPSGDCGHPGVSFNTIQDGINAVQTGGTVNVAAGTYQEQITIAKPLTVTGADGAVLDGTGLLPAWTTGVKIRSGNVTYNNIDVTNFTQDGITAYDNIDMPNLHITNSKISNIQPGYWGFGIYVGYESEGFEYTPPDLTGHLDFSGLLIEGNEITNVHSSALVLQSITGAPGTLQVRNNYIHDNTTNSGIWVDCARNLVIENNTLVNNKWGIEFSAIPEFDNPSFLNGPYSPKDVTLGGNSISASINQGIVLYQAWPGTFTVIGNGLQGNLTGIDNQLAETLTARNNWWNAVSGPGGVGPGTGDTVSAYVDYTPWCTDAACAAFAPPFTTATTITADTPDPSLLNQTVSVTATVDGLPAGAPTPTGTVTISGGVTDCTITLVSGTGSCDITFDTGGAKTITATYDPDSADFSASSDTENHSVVVMLTSTFTSQGAYDGWVLESTETSTLGGSLNSTALLFRLGDDAADKQYRAILSFNTGSLPNNAVITKAIIKIKLFGVVGTNPYTSHGILYLDINTGSFGNAGLEPADFQTPASLNSAGSIPNSPVNNWYSRVLKGTALTYINKLARTQFRLRFQLGDNDDLGADYLSFYSGDYFNVAARPTLIIKYYVP